MAGFSIFQSEFFTYFILPFVLVFTLLFAILDKTKILGEGKRQINAIISLAIALIFVSFTNAVGIIVNLMGVLAVIAVVLLVFIILFAFASSKGEFEMPKGLKIAFGILIGIALIIALIVFTGYWDTVKNAVMGGTGIVTDIIFVGIIVAAIAIVLWSGEKK